MKASFISLFSVFLLVSVIGCGGEPETVVMPEPTAEEEERIMKSEMENEALMNDPSER